jgi:uncharacterized membrane protein YphA (DoxX/SURF4 family)
MLSIFPSLYTYGLVAPLIIRMALAAAFGWIGSANAKSKSPGGKFHILGVIEMFLALFIFIGLFTQLMALFIAIILAVKLAYKVKQGAFLSNGVNYYLILLVMAVSLMFSGAGWLAFDLPL